MKRGLIILIAIVAIVGGYFLYKNKNQAPKVEIGEKIEDQGADHVDDIFGVEYNSNPPTSGTHFPMWAKPGLYNQLISDGYLIHSMEHGYIIIWYNCDKMNTSFKLIPEAKAHGDEVVTTSSPSATIVPLMHMTPSENPAINWITPQTLPPAEVQLPLSFQTPGCNALISELTPYLKTAQRVIIAPRINMDTKLAITAWNRIAKLDSIDSEKINEFIKQYHNQGPEKTME